MSKCRFCKKAKASPAASCDCESSKNAAGTRLKVSNKKSSTEPPKTLGNSAGPAPSKKAITGKRKERDKSPEGEESASSDALEENAQPRRSGRASIPTQPAGTLPIQFPFQERQRSQQLGNSWYFQASGFSGSFAGDCGVIRIDEFLIVIDTGLKTKMIPLSQEFYQNAVRDCRKKLLITTHWHSDHAGNARLVREGLEKGHDKRTQDWWPMQPAFDGSVSQALASSSFSLDASIQRNSAATTKAVEGGLVLVTCRNAPPRDDQNYGEWNKYRNVGTHSTTRASWLSKASSKRPAKKTKIEAPESKWLCYEGDTDKGRKISIMIFDSGISSIDSIQNETSLGVVVKVDDWKLLSLGDMKIDAQEIMEKDLPEKTFNVVKMSHHGSRGNIYWPLLSTTDNGTILSSGHTCDWANMDSSKVKAGLEDVVPHERSNVTIALLQEKNTWGAQGENSIGARAGESFREIGGIRHLYQNGFMTDIPSSAGETHDQDSIADGSDGEGGENVAMQTDDADISKVAESSRVQASFQSGFSDIHGYMGLNLTSAVELVEKYGTPVDNLGEKIGQAGQALDNLWGRRLENGEPLDLERYERDRERLQHAQNQTELDSILNSSSRWLDSEHKTAED